jgi:REP element-mobilizing transposase RayT
VSLQGLIIIRPYEEHNAMTYSHDIHHRRTIRLQGYDYSAGGMYFVTLCIKGRKRLFGNIFNEKMDLNDAGKAAHEYWNGIPLHFPHALLDEFIVMPNHVHGIIVLEVDNHSSRCLPIPGGVGANNYSPLRGTSRTIGSIVRGFKIGVTKWIRANTAIVEVWQRNYWERIIRNEEELNETRKYIQNNPAQWENDKLYFPQTDVSAQANNYLPIDTPMPDGNVGANDYSPLRGKT